MKSTTERAAEIRQTLKARYGWTSRDVSVKADYYSMGSSIRIRIKNPTVSSKAVEAIAEQHESIDRDQWGEILSGGNRFVFVNYDHDTLDRIGATVRPAVDAAVTARANADDNSLIDVAGTPYLLGAGRHGYGFSVWGPNGHLQEVNDAAAAAQTIGVALLNGKAVRS